MTTQDWMFQQEEFGLHLVTPLLILGLLTQIANQTKTNHSTESIKNMKQSKHNLITEKFLMWKGEILPLLFFNNWWNVSGMQKVFLNKLAELHIIKKKTHSQDVVGHLRTRILDQVCSAETIPRCKERLQMQNLQKCFHL